jgi:[pyruvate, water dikinase]-phosphate phosphotransferase / [pyruvate, water dikinase] kinase
MRNFHVLIMSDGTGETAYRMLKAAMRQFQEDILITRYANVRDEQQIRDILRAAVENHTLVAYTFVSPQLRSFMRQAAEEEGAECVDLLGPLMEKLSGFFKKAPVATPGLLHQVDEEYFTRIDAIEFAIRHDDGHSVKDLDAADLVIVGVSRASKTPVSIYLAQEGWKVANITIVAGMKLPSELFQIDQHKIVGLTINPARLREMREVRLQQLGVDDSSYADERRVMDELEYAHVIYRQNPSWPVIDVTGKSVEEISQEILDQLVGRGRKL